MVVKFDAKLEMVHWPVHKLVQSGGPRPLLLKSHPACGSNAPWGHRPLQQHQIGFSFSPPQHICLTPSERNFIFLRLVGIIGDPDLFVLYKIYGRRTFICSSRRYT